jgi:hypothetical protein
MRERRVLERTEINQIALLYVDGIRGCYPCSVLNCHHDGAILHSSTHHAAAFNFALSLDGFKTTRHCRAMAERKYLRCQICRSKAALAQRTPHSHHDRDDGDEQYGLQFGIGKRDHGHHFGARGPDSSRLLRSPRCSASAIACSGFGSNRDKPAAFNCFVRATRDTQPSSGSSVCPSGNEPRKSLAHFPPLLAPDSCTAA